MVDVFGALITDELPKLVPAQRLSHDTQGILYRRLLAQVCRRSCVTRLPLALWNTRRLPFDHLFTNTNH
jgi:hypothetical protein